MDCNASTIPVIKADPDVAGPGVVIAFILSAATTILAMLLGYGSRTLPLGATNDLDIWTLSRLRKLIPSRAARVPISKSLSRSSTLNDAAVPAYNDRDSQNQITRDQIARSLHSFIATLSDQQLVTGPALLIAAYIKNQSISLYHFRIITAIAWFSATVHWVSLKTLKTYFINCVFTVYWRIAWIVVFLVLLITAQVAIVGEIDPSFPVQCVFRGYAKYEDPLTVAGAIVTALLFLTLYFDATMPILLQDLNWEWSSWMVSNAASAIRHIRGRSSDQHNNVPPSRGVEEDMIGRARRQETKRYHAYAVRLSDCSASRFKLRLTLISILNAEFGRSFLSNIFNAVFIFIYGTSVTFKIRNAASPEIRGSQDAMGFGQIVPLLLLLLPVFPALDLYEGKPKLIRRSHIPNQGGSDPMDMNTKHGVDCGTKIEQAESAPIPQSLTRSHSGDTLNVDKEFNLSRLEELAQMIDLCLRFSRSKPMKGWGTLPTHKRPENGRMSKGLAVWGIFGDRSAHRTMSKSPKKSSQFENSSPSQRHHLFKTPPRQTEPSPRISLPRIETEEISIHSPTQIFADIKLESAESLATPIQSKVERERSNSPDRAFSAASGWQKRAEIAIHTCGLEIIEESMKPSLSLRNILIIVAGARYILGMFIALALSATWGTTAALVATGMIVSYIPLYIAIFFPMRIMKALKEDKLKRSGRRSTDLEHPHHLVVSLAWLDSARTATDHFKEKPDTPTIEV